MKKIFLLLPLLVLIGCSQVKEVPKTYEISGIDFTKYTEKGFLVTNKEYSGEYESIGIFSCKVNPGLAQKETKDTSFDSWQRTSTETYVVNPDVYEAIDFLYNHVTKLGADALVELKIEHSAYVIEDEYLAKSIEVSGFAIRRKKTADL